MVGGQRGDAEVGGEQTPPPANGAPSGPLNPQGPLLHDKIDDRFDTITRL